jgi:hypothetical protein
LDFNRGKKPVIKSLRGDAEEQGRGDGVYGVVEVG